MAIIFILSGSVIGFMLGSAGLLLGSGFTVAMMLWMGAGLVAALLAMALALIKPQDDLQGHTQSA